MERNSNVYRVDDLCMYFRHITQTKIGVSDSAEPTMVGDEADTGCADCEDEGVVHVQVACQDGCAEVDERSLLHAGVDLLDHTRPTDGRLFRRHRSWILLYKPLITTAEWPIARKTRHP